MAAPATTGSFADELYELLAPALGPDEAFGWAALHWVSAFSQPFQAAEDIGRDQPDGTPGWGILLDLARCPTWGLGWLGMLRGVRMLPVSQFSNLVEWDAAMRARIAGTDGQNRGSASAMAVAAEPYLTGTRYVIFNERASSDPYRLAVRTLTSETPDPAAVLAALLEQKPAGIVLDYATIVGVPYDALEAAFDTYAEFEAFYATYADAETNLP